MSRIQQLDPHVVNRIAAGEVIERPGSVVKELLENSVDAGSTRIEINTAEGGTQLIRISDNGEGIHSDDMLLAVTSHATSKIRSDADLDQVSTLGFRGEALASIASVSRFRIRTRPADEPAGSELQCDGGVITRQQQCGCPPGTTIEVQNLFYNTPARRKFLKRPATEFGHISEQFTRVALANPALHLVLTHNDNLVHELPSTHSTLERIRRFYGSDLADKLIAVESEAETASAGPMRLWGYVADPSVSKSTRKNQYLFLNGRCIQDRSLQHALSEAYRGLLMVGRHPVSFLFLELPPSLVDVNVHPTKNEVRFADSQSLYRQLLRTLRDKFLSLDFRANLGLEEAAGKSTLKLSQEARTSAERQKELNLWAGQKAIHPPQVATSAPHSRHSTPPGHEPAHPSESTPRAPVADFHPFPSNTSPFQSHSAAVPAEIPSSPSTTTTESSESPEVSAGADAGSLPGPPTSSDSTDVVIADEFRAFQIHDCYLVVATDAGLEVIDQHALHERILYEHLRQKILDSSVERQRLLIPEPVELSATEAAVLAEYSDVLQQAGFEVQEFGGTTVLLTAYPVLMPRGGLAETVKQLAEQLDQTDGKTSRRDLLDRMLHTMACRGAIKSGQRLTVEEMQELLRQRHLVDDSHHCPHGRPTALTLTRGNLDQQFGRLG